MCMCLCVWMCVCVYVCVYECIWMCVCVYVCTYVCMSAFECVYVCMCILFLSLSLLTCLHSIEESDGQRNERDDSTIEAYPWGRDWGQGWGRGFGEQCDKDHGQRFLIACFFLSLHTHSCHPSFSIKHTVWPVQRFWPTMISKRRTYHWGRHWGECVTHTYTHNIIHTTHIHTHTFKHTYTIHTYTQTHIHTYTHSNALIHTYVHTYTHTHIQMHSYTHTYTHTHIHTHKHIHIHTHSFYRLILKVYDNLHKLPKDIQKQTLEEKFYIIAILFEVSECESVSHSSHRMGKSNMPYHCGEQALCKHPGLWLACRLFWIDAWHCQRTCHCVVERHLQHCIKIRRSCHPQTTQSCCFFFLSFFFERRKRENKKCP